MIRIAFLASMVAIIGFTSCTKEDELVSFEFTQEHEFTMSDDSISIDTALALTSIDIRSKLQESSEQNNSLLSLVKEVEIVSVSVEAVDPSSQTLSFLEDVELFITSGTLAELMVAAKNPVPTTQGTSMDLDVDQEVGVLQYLKNTNFKFRVSYHQREKLPQVTKFKVTGTFKAVATIET